MGKSVEERQGHIQFKYGGIVVKGVFPATREQAEKDWLHDKYAHFECEDKRVLSDVQFYWRMYHFENWETMQYKVWRPTDFGAFVKDFVETVLKARVISFKKQIVQYEPGHVY